MELEYAVIYSKRKKLTITVERDRTVVVRAPEGIAPEKIRQVVQSRRRWIFEKTRDPQKYQGLIHPPGKELVSGEAIPYLGRNYRIELSSTGRRILFENSKFVVPKALAGDRKRLFQRWYRKKAKEKILPRVQLHARSLGVDYNQVRISGSRYRWGSCTPRDNIVLNWRLIKAPMFVVDYVILHELAHLLESNHTPRFWNIIRSQIVNYEKAKSWLRENGEILEQDL